MKDRVIFESMSPPILPTIPAGDRSGSTSKADGWIIITDMSTPIYPVMPGDDGKEAFADIAAAFEKAGMQPLGKEFLVPSYSFGGTTPTTIAEADGFVFPAFDTDADDDGVVESIWMDLGFTVEALERHGADGPTCDPAANPVLIVVADGNDFYVNE